MLKLFLGAVLSSAIITVVILGIFVVSFVDKAYRNIIKNRRRYDKRHTHSR